MRTNHTASNRAPAWTAAAVPTITGMIEASNRMAWDALIHSSAFIKPRRPRTEKRVPSSSRRDRFGPLHGYHIRKYPLLRNVPFWIALSGIVLISECGAG